MNLDLEHLLEHMGVTFSRLQKSEKVKILTRWIREFPELIDSARHQQVTEGVLRDGDADAEYAHVSEGDFYILPDDASGMPSCYCIATKPPIITELVSDTFTKCDEIIVVDVDFLWSAVFVNHGSPEFVGRHFKDRRVRNAGTTP